MPTQTTVRLIGLCRLIATQNRWTTKSQADCRNEKSDVEWKRKKKYLNFANIAQKSKAKSFHRFLLHHSRPSSALLAALAKVMSVLNISLFGVPSIFSVGPKNEIERAFASLSGMRGLWHAGHGNYGNWGDDVTQSKDACDTWWIKVDAFELSSPQPSRDLFFRFWSVGFSLNHNH